MSNFAELPPPTVPALSKTQIPLFRNPFYKDWPVILGLFAVASGAASNVGTSGNFLEFRPDDWAAFVVNIAFVAGVQGTIFGVIPALIRRKLNRRRVNFENKHEVFSNKLFLGTRIDNRGHICSPRIVRTKKRRQFFHWSQ